jgi:hypothetical protein
MTFYEVLSVWTNKPFFIAYSEVLSRTDPKCPKVFLFVPRGFRCFSALSSGDTEHTPCFRAGQVVLCRFLAVSDAFPSYPRGTWSVYIAFAVFWHHSFILPK